MLKDLDQSVDLLCDFYNLDLQLDEPIEALLGEPPGSDLSPDLNAMKDAIDAAEKGDNHHLNRLLRDLSETGQKRARLVEVVNLLESRKTESQGLLPTRKKGG